MPNGQETDVHGSSSSPDVDVWVTDPEEGASEPVQARSDSGRPLPSPHAAVDLRLPPRPTAIGPDAEPAIDTRDLPPLPSPPQVLQGDVQTQAPTADEIARWQAVIADYEREA